MSESEVDVRISDAAALAAKQLLAAWGVAKEAAKTSDGQLTTALIGPILQAIVSNMHLERTHA